MSEATDIRAVMDEFGDERLDYTKPPPGYVPHQFRGNFRGAPGAYSLVGALIEAHARDKAAQGRYADS